MHALHGIHRVEDCGGSWKQTLHASGAAPTGPRARVQTVETDLGEFQKSPRLLLFRAALLLRMGTTAPSDCTPSTTRSRPCQRRIRPSTHPPHPLRVCRAINVDNVTSAHDRDRRAVVLAFTGVVLLVGVGASYLGSPSRDEGQDGRRPSSSRQVHTGNIYTSNDQEIPIYAFEGAPARYPQYSEYFIPHCQIDIDDARLAFILSDVSIDGPAHIGLSARRHHPRSRVRRGRAISRASKTRGVGHIFGSPLSAARWFGAHLSTAVRSS